MRKERSERFMVRRKFLQDAGLGDAVKPLASPTDTALKTMHQASSGLDRRSLEEEARKDSLQGSNPTSRFWNRQRGWQVSESVGLRLIDMMEAEGEKKTK